MYPKKVLNAVKKMVEAANGEYWNEAVALYDHELRTCGKFSLNQLQIIHELTRCTIAGRI